MDVITESAVTHTPSEQSAQGKVEKKSGKRIGYYYIILKSLRESQKNDVVKCLYIKGLFNFGFCVIKEGSYGDTKDKHGRDIKDRLMWQEQLHKDLQGKLRLPKLLGSFEENGNYYLVIEYVRGKSLYDLLKKKKNQEKLRHAFRNGEKMGWQFIHYLEQLAGLLDILHQQQYVHRDVTPSNFIISPGKYVHVIDMELSYSLTGTPSPPFQWGTLGYMSASQKAQETPVIGDDIFSLGAIILQVLSGIHPLKLVDADPTLLPAKIQFFIRDQKMTDLIIQCLHPDASQRPSAGVVRQALHEYKNDYKKKKVRLVAPRPSSFGKEEIAIILQQGINTLSTPLLSDEEKGWFAEDVHAESINEKNAIEKAWYASFNLGASGVIYFLSKAFEAGLDVEPAIPFVHKGIQLIEEKYVNRTDIPSPSLNFGAGGVAASLSVAMQSGLLSVDNRYINWMDYFLEISNPDINLEIGLAGQGIAHFICNPFIEPAILHERLQRYTNEIISQQQPDGSWVRSIATKDKKPKKTRGLSAGVAGIAYFLLEYGSRFNHQPAVDAATNGLKWLMEKAVKNRKSFYWTSSQGDELGYGCMEGNAGIALVFLKAYKELGSSLYKEYSRRALLSVDPELINDNVGQKSGLSGLGEVYLEAFSIMQEEEWLQRADSIAQLIMRLQKNHRKYGVYWLVEGEKQPVPNFMTGNAGVLHFLLRYSYKERIGFPVLP